MASPYPTQNVFTPCSQGEEPIVTPSCHPGDMNDQLALLEDDNRQWRLDERTREIGLRGVAQAREALRQADRQAERRAA